ncbi:E3 binding domain-containing protein [Haladaptatus halobius]|uniref:E3 binding domain-containing protein n=1 Tax=Haladaptatus halobius TaxID=2884875 RepID=UPI001D0B1A93|nr:E3 binding domain-containing protein [Haladaptatus halobius]
MGYIVKMPKLGLEMEQGTVLTWSVETGDDVAEGDMIAEVESEKSIGEVEAREDGVLRRIYVEVDESVPPGKPIGIVAAADADISGLETEAEAELDGEVTEEGETKAAPTDANADASTPDSEDSASVSSSTATVTEVKASPRAEKRAEELGVDLTTVEGTGPQDAITAEDVEAATESADESTDSVKASPRAKKRAEELGVDLTTVDGTGPQGAITADDVKAVAETPPADTGEPEGIRRITPEQEGAYRYQQTTAVADPPAAKALLETTEAVRTAFEERVTISDVMLVVTSATLTDCPTLNATYSEATHQLQKKQDVAIATDIDDDPIASVIADVESKSVTDIVKARQEGSSDDASGHQPTFTLANAATGDADGRLVNPPGVATLEVDPTGQRAIPDGEGVELQPLVTASLTYDTNAIGFDDAEQFLERFFEHAQQASELVLGTYRGRE